MRPLAFSLLRELSHAHFTSGAMLASKYAVSRSAISDALGDAREAGIGILSLTRKGYRLALPLEMLDIERIRAALGATAKRVDVLVLPTVDSTNSALMERASGGAPSGLCLVAESQTAGRGRRGRVWHSAFGESLMFSLLWRFDKGAAELGGLSLVVGLAVVRALRASGLTDAGRVGLKWPNDVIADNAKLAGVLIESQGEMAGPTAVVIGIGINIGQSAAMTARIDQPSTAVAALTSMPPSRNLLLAAVLRELVTLLDIFRTRGFAALKGEWQAQHVLHGKPVRVLFADGSGVDATVKTVGDDGALIVTVNGRALHIVAGEVSLRQITP